MLYVVQNGTIEREREYGSLDMARLSGGRLKKLPIGGSPKLRVGGSVELLPPIAEPWAKGKDRYRLSCTVDVCALDLERDGIICIGLSHTLKAESASEMEAR